MNLTLQVDQDTIYLRATWERIKLEHEPGDFKTCLICGVKPCFMIPVATKSSCTMRANPGCIHPGASKDALELQMI